MTKNTGGRFCVRLNNESKCVTDTFDRLVLCFNCVDLVVMNVKYMMQYTMQHLSKLRKKLLLEHLKL